MHDPSTVAHEIKSPFRCPPDKLFPEGYRRTLVTIWHEDPETDGSDDSCGWFIRARHLDPALRTRVRRDFRFNWTWSGGWFDEQQRPKFSSAAITLLMVQRAAYEYFEGSWSKVERFLRKHAAAILIFGENGHDSMHDIIVNRWKSTASVEARADECADIVLAWVARQDRPWWRHPRWHVHHWRVQVHWVQNFKRWAFSRCAACGKRFRWGYAPVSHMWDGGGPRWFRSEPEVYHGQCSRYVPKQPANPKETDGAVS